MATASLDEADVDQVFALSLLCLPAETDLLFVAEHLTPLLTSNLLLQALSDDAGLQRLQKASWLAIGPVQPVLAESVSPSLMQAALLVRPASPALQIRRLTQGSPIIAFAPLPAGSKPFSLPQWSASGEHVSVFFEGPPAAGVKHYSACVLRLADQATQQIQLETVPGSAKAPGTYDMAALWAPSAPTLIVVRDKPMQQTSECFRRSRLKAVGCQLVYHDAKGSCEAQLQCSPDGTKLAYRTADQAIAIHYISTGATAVVEPHCGKWLCLTFAPSSFHMLCIGQSDEGKQQAAILPLREAPCAQAACIVPGSMLMGIAWSAKDCVAIACSTGSEQVGPRGTLTLFTVVTGPALQLLHTLDTGGFVEDLSFSPDGTMLCFLDQGNDWFMPPPVFRFYLKPESEVVVLHLPSQQARKFGSRKEGREACGSDRYMSSVPLGMSDIIKWPGRARLWWQGSSLMSYGPGLGTSHVVPGPHAAVMMRATDLSPSAYMPCERLDLD